MSDAERTVHLARPLPESGNEIGTLIVLRKWDLEMSDGSQGAHALIHERVAGIKTRGDTQAYARHVLEKRRRSMKGERDRAPTENLVEPL